ncbi:small multidrug efflux protein [Pseudonocardia pini]|uniref:small multidrug efflux protein n=1 Tax=Pseudonocardia pini TaxID=2758030 RepID=UPI0015F0C2DB|nr:small multidrug efflux protein [Pseudonocardia pini]
MNPVADLARNFQELVAQVPDLVQPLIVVLAGAVPFIEGEGATAIGVVGGLHPLLAGVAAAVGNFLSVLVVVLVSSRARVAAVNRRAGRAGAAGTALAEPESKGRRRFRRWLVRFGVPGASLLGPLAIPTQFTSAMLVATGIPRGRVLLWQGIAIVLWTTATTVVVWGVLTAVLT